MKLQLNNKELKDLDCFIEIFSDYYVDEKNISCFKTIKKLIQLNSDIETEQFIDIIDIIWQLNQAFEFLYSLYVDTTTVEKLINLFDSISSSIEIQQS